MRSVSAEENKQRVLELIERVMNGHEANALGEFTSNPAVLGAAQGLLHSFPDLEAKVQWIVAENDMVVAFHSIRGTQQGPWLFVREPTGSVVETAFYWRSGSMTTGRSSINGSGRTSSKCWCRWAGALPRSASPPRSRTEPGSPDVRARNDPRPSLQSSAHLQPQRGCSSAARRRVAYSTDSRKTAAISSSTVVVDGNS